MDLCDLFDDLAINQKDVKNENADNDDGNEL